MDRLWDKGLNYARKGMHLVWMLYLFALTGILPLYLDLRTGYGKIDSDKFGCFWTASLWAVRCFFVLLIFYLFILSVKWYKSRRPVFSGQVLLLNRLKKKLSVTDIFALLYGFGLILSYCFSPYQKETLIGTDGWYMGLLPQLILIGGYFITSRLLTVKEIKWLACTIMTTSLLVFLLAVLNRYGINCLNISKTNPVFLSTIGNINWLCGYWSVVFPLGCGLFWLCTGQECQSLSSALHRLFSGSVSVIGFTAVLVQGSESGILALAALLLLMGWLAGGRRLWFMGFWEMLLLFSAALAFLQIIHLFFPDKNTLPTPFYRLLTGTPLLWAALGLTLICCFFLQSQKYGKQCFEGIKGIWRAGTMFAIASVAVYIIMLAANSLMPGCLGPLSHQPVFLFDENWGSARGGTWRAGMSTWLSQDLLHRFTGVGPDGMAAYLYGGDNFSLLKTVIKQFGQHTLTNAHNEWITLLANSGIIGLFSFAGMVISSIIRYLKSDKLWCIVCGLCLFSYTVNNIFSFQQIMNITQLFILLGMGEAVMRRE